MSLAEYRRKRHFHETPEPAGKATKRRPRGGLRFVVQKHAATRLHYDFRLEHEGTLKSWAVPKGPCFDPVEKRLAVEVEDHPLEYATFEGTIPAGEYGAGEVIVWDRGVWHPQRDAAAGLKAGKLEFELEGEKLTGGWVLLRIKGRAGEKKQNWLLVKRRDDSAQPLADFDVTVERPQSVKSGRSLETSQPHAPSTNGKPRQRRSRKVQSPLPDAIDVQLATLAAEPPPGSEWLHEIKFDGYRLIVRLEKGTARLITRNQLDWTEKFPAIAAAAASLPADSAILDGELVALLDNGVSSFQNLQNAARRHSPERLAYFAFDLLYLDGRDWRKEPLDDRKARLQKLIARARQPQLQYSEHFLRDGDAFWQECCRRGLEGIVSKRRDRPYRGGRTADWLKIKCLAREELVIGGFTPSPAKHRSLGALLVGYFEKDRGTGDKLVYAGRVGTGMDAQMLADLRKRLDKLERKTSAFETIPSREQVAGIHWVRPRLVAQIDFAGWTGANVVRHASFQGLREDKEARTVGKPESLSLSKSSADSQPRKASPAGRKKPSRRKTATTRRDGQAKSPATLPIRLTHPERVLFPDIGRTKLDLANYYTRVADWILPHLADRPLSMLRCPKGEGEKCFFQKHAAAGTPAELRRIDVAVTAGVEKDGLAEYLIADDLPGLLALAQMSILEIHPWGSRGDRLEQPDRLIFDLDPGADVAWTRVIAAARLVRETLDQLHLQSFVKTTGGKGLHVVVPLEPRRHAWPAAKHFAQAVARHLAEQQPERYTVSMSKAARRGKIFIDYLRNDRGATAVAPYSTRAKPGAPVSTPLAWDELSPKLKSDHFRLDTLPRRLESLASDPWTGFFECRQQLPTFVAR
ncbi:MAG: DNA ligase D [Pirellulaceae bacterium]